MELNVEQVRNFRLHAHHLDTFYVKADVLAAVGACGMQNTPPGAWEAALFNRVPACKAADRDRLLLEERAPRSCRRLRRRAENPGSTRGASGWRSTFWAWGSTSCWSCWSRSCHSWTGGR